MPIMLPSLLRWLPYLWRWNGGRWLKGPTVGVVILTILLQEPSAVLAVTWPIERHYFEDKLPDQPSENSALEKSWVEPLTGITFIFLPAGCFNMGDSDAGIVGEVCVKEFYLSKYETTNAQFRRFRSTHDSGSYRGHSLDDDNQPVVNVSWRDAMAFATWLSNETGKRIRLATEAEWEYACWAGRSEVATEELGEPGNLRGNEEQANASQVDSTVAVGSYAAGPYGLFDMHGNASEWVLDSYIDDNGRFGSGRVDPRVEIESNPLRVRRGGSWTSSASQSRCATRDYYLGELAVPHTGFRLLEKSSS